MDFCDISPYVRYAEQLTGNDACVSAAEAAYDHVLWYGLTGETLIRTDDQEWRLQRGSVLLLPPSFFYTVSVPENASYIKLHFDYTKSPTPEHDFYLKPDTEDSFDDSQVLPREPIDSEPSLDQPLFVHGLTHLEEPILSIVCEFASRDKYFDFRIRCCLGMVLTDLVRQYCSTAKKQAKDVSFPADELLDYIHKNYQHDISNDRIAAHFHLLPKQLNALIRKKTGYSTHKYIIMRRVSKAIDLLQNTDLRIYEIANRVGFSDECHFSKCFKQMMGKSPGAFRKR